MVVCRIKLFRRIVLVLIFTLFFVGFSVLRTPSTTGEPSASLADKGLEDLSRVEYPSLKDVKWHEHFINPNETLESLFGADWIWVARFNRLDRRHVYPGMTIKVPDNMQAAHDYCPLPKYYEAAGKYHKYILVDVTEQWLGAYEKGKLVFSAPAATGKEGTETPIGIFHVDARHLTHTSSLYKTAGDEEQYPMDNALRFHIGEDNVSYWIHARDLPGRPASHGCIGLFDEDMQLRVFGTPLKPVLLDSEKLYEWAVGDDEYGDDDGSLDELEDGPVVEVRGSLPRYLAKGVLHN